MPTCLSGTLPILAQSGWKRFLNLPITSFFYHNNYIILAMWLFDQTGILATWNPRNRQEGLSYLHPPFLPSAPLSNSAGIGGFLQGVEGREVLNGLLSRQHQLGGKRGLVLTGDSGNTPLCYQYSNPQLQGPSVSQDSIDLTDLYPILARKLSIRTLCVESLLPPYCLPS